MSGPEAGAWRVPAVGGERDVPEPDPIARDYLLLALRLDQHAPGLVDGFFGPAALKAQVDLEPLRAPARLVADAAELLGRLDGEVSSAERREWLALQVRALQTHAETLAGIERPYAELVERCFAVAPAAHDHAVFAAARAELEDLLPGQEPLVDRLAAWDAGLVVPAQRLGPIVDWLVAELRRRAEPVFGLPAGETLRVSLVRDQPWSGYNWYDGGLRSRVDLNVDLPIRAPDLVATVAHETYAGHHLEHTWKEAELVERRAQLEASILVINAPECFLSEGLAEVGPSLLLGADGEAELLAELLDRAGLPVPADRATAGELARRAVDLRTARARLRAADVDAALKLHAEGRPRAEVMDWLARTALLTPERAAKKLEFLEHPLWRTYVFVYTEGAALLDRWLGRVPSAERPARYRRLLVEPLTPAAIEREIAAA